jgi:hypothetical protein
MKKIFVCGLLISLLGCSDSKFTSHPDGGDNEGGTSSGDGAVPFRPTCPTKESTISGTVLAPNGTDPVPGATVFIPSVLPELFPPDVKCEVCGQLSSSVNYWTAVSAFDGTFTLTDVCPGKRPVVFQNGRFRRLIYVEVPTKGEVKLTPEETRLPRKNKEFESIDAIPRVAVATGDYDKMECVLRKIGLADGAFDLYEGAKQQTSPKKLPSFATLVGDPDTMKGYNIIFINCTDNTFEDELNKKEVRQSLNEYVQAGGRLYVTDWSYDWIEQVDSFSPFIDYEPGPTDDDKPEKMNDAILGKGGIEVMATIKDPQMAKWLGLFPGAIQGGKSKVEHFLSEWVMMNRVNKDVKIWVEGKVQDLDYNIDDVRPLTVTFNFENCGKILYTSYHTEGREDEIFPPPFPEYCDETASPQDRILE